VGGYEMRPVALGPGDMNARQLVLAASAVLLLVPLGCSVERPGASGQSRSAATSQASKPALGTAPTTPKDASVQTVPALQPEGQRVQRSAQLTLEVAGGSFEK